MKNKSSETPRTGFACKPDTKIHYLKTLEGPNLKQIDGSIAVSLETYHGNVPRSPPRLAVNRQLSACNQHQTMELGRSKPSFPVQLTGI